MDVSVIIVNYNVKHFLFNCLTSVERALKNSVTGEIIVVDNSSSDDSVAMVKEHFPGVCLIENADNEGFSKANNKGICAASGEFILMLNPDTIIAEDTLSQCVSFMRQHPDAGAMGVRMIDGNGVFLPESKRGLPTPDVAFYKITGISRLFSRSATYNRYHAGHLPENETNETDVLSGAFMFMRMEALNKSGLLDEDFFMYGEDIDLSYRICKAGYKNYYFPHTTIIHYKGESTKKSSINYVLVFYKAMEIFARKHFVKKIAGYYAFFIRLAIWVRASISIGRRLFERVLMPASDFVLVYFFSRMIAHLYEQYFRISGNGNYPEELVHHIMLGLAALLVITSFFSGAYDRPFTYRKLFRGLQFTALFVVLGYAFLPEHMRFSRAVIFLSALSLFALMPVYRYVLHSLKFIRMHRPGYRRVALMATENDARELTELMHLTQYAYKNICYVKPSQYSSSAESSIIYSGNDNHLFDLVKMYRLNNIIISANATTFKDIITRTEQKHKAGNPELKIASEQNRFIIGSNSVLSADTYYAGLLSLLHPGNLRSKRVFDVFFSLLFLLFFPVLLIISGNAGVLLDNIWRVFIGKYTFVGLYRTVGTTNGAKIKPGILLPAENEILSTLTAQQQHEANIEYVNRYAVWKDFRLVFSSLNQLSRQVETSEV